MAAASSAPLISRCARTPTASLASTKGLLEVALTAQPNRQTLSGQSVNLLSYNRQLPGPLLEAHGGDTVRLTLSNKLDTATNLHYHGLHISPQIDDVFREVAPGEQYIYEFQIPDNHPAVTAWYHPHYHLDVAPQVFGGLAGPLIIRGEVDEIPEIQQADEALLLLQDVPDSRQALQDPHPLAKRWGREGSLILASGQ